MTGLFPLSIYYTDQDLLARETTMQIFLFYSYTLLTDTGTMWCHTTESPTTETQTPEQSTTHPNTTDQETTTQAVIQSTNHSAPQLTTQGSQRPSTQQSQHTSEVQTQQSTIQPTQQSTAQPTQQPTTPAGKAASITYTSHSLATALALAGIGFYILF